MRRATSSASTGGAALAAELEDQLAELQDRLGIHFKDKTLLEQALVHRSLLRDQSAPGLQSNERLEFLGDAIIGYLVADHLFEQRPSASEGELTLLRTMLVRASTLAAWAQELDLVHYLRLGRSDEGTRRRTRLLARTFEAVVGAIYADQGIQATKAFLLPYVVRECSGLPSGELQLDSKSRLQQVTQSRYDLVPSYVVLEVSGPGHDPTFTVEVQVGSVLRCSGQGGTKQEAEQVAARSALAALEVDETVPPAPKSDSAVPTT